MNKLWSAEAWDNYTYWLDYEDKNSEKVNNILAAIDSGDIELLKDDSSDSYSLNIDERNKLVFKLHDNTNTIEILQCGTSYQDK